MRYKKILQICQTIIDEFRFKNELKAINLGDKPFTGYLEFESCKELDYCQKISSRKGFDNNILQDTQKIPITEDYRDIYTYLAEVKDLKPLDQVSIPKMTAKTDLEVTDNSISNSKISLKVIGNNILINNDIQLEFVDYIDNGDSYNDGPVADDEGITADIISTKTQMNGSLRSSLKTYSEDFNELIERAFDPDYDIRQNLPKTRGIEAKSNTAPMQRFVWANDLGIFTKGITQYEVFKDMLSIPLLRATGVISNPKNSSRSTPAGPPLETPALQQLGKNKAEFAVYCGDVNGYERNLEQVYPQVVA